MEQLMTIEIPFEPFKKKKKNENIKFIFPTYQKHTCRKSGLFDCTSSTIMASSLNGTSE